MSIGVNWAEVWAPVWKAVWTQAPPVPTPTPSPPAPSGGRAKRSRPRRYTIRIEGRIFDADDEAQAIAILKQAAALAETAANRKADDIVERALPKAVALGKVKPITIKVPSFDASPALEHQAAITRRAIERAYANASALAELRLLLALQEMQAEEDEEELLLLH